MEALRNAPGPLDQLSGAANAVLSNWLVSLIVLVALVLIFGLPGWIAAGRKSEGASGNNPNVDVVASANNDMNKSLFDASNMSSGSNRDATYFASAPGAHNPGDFVDVSELAAGGPAAHLRWCGVKNLGQYKAQGYGAMKNPRGWLLNTAYEGEPSLRSVPSREGYASAKPEDVLTQAAQGL